MYTSQLQVTTTTTKLHVTLLFRVAMHVPAPCGRSQKTLLSTLLRRLAQGRGERGEGEKGRRGEGEKGRRGMGRERGMYLPLQAS